MHVLKPVLFLALFLLFITLLALADSGNASERSRSQLSGDTPFYAQGYLHDAHEGHIADWRYERWTPARYGAAPDDHDGTRQAILQFEQSGLITGTHTDKNGLKVVEVSDLFLRLADSDKRRVMLTLAQGLSSGGDVHPPALAIQHGGTRQFLGVFTYQGLQLQ